MFLGTQIVEEVSYQSDTAGYGIRMATFVDLQNP